MKLSFDAIPEKALPKFQGGEGELRARIFADEHNKVLLATLAPGHSVGMHTHETSSEIIYILQGEGESVCQGQTEHLRPGDGQYCPKGASHNLVNVGEGDLVFFAVVPQQ